MATTADPFTAVCSANFRTEASNSNRATTQFTNAMRIACVTLIMAPASSISIATFWAARLIGCEVV